MIAKLFGCHQCPAVRSDDEPRRAAPAVAYAQSAGGAQHSCADHAQPAGQASPQPAVVAQPPAPRPPQPAPLAARHAAPDASTTRHVTTAAAGHVGSRRLMRGLRDIQAATRENRWCEVTPRDDNMSVWDIKFYFASGKLHDSLKKRRQTHVQLEMTFPSDYPYQKPALRIVSPQIESVLDGTASIFGGAFCLDAIQAWSAVTSEGSLLMTLHTAMAGAKVKNNKSWSAADYVKGEKHILQQHPQWKPAPKHG